MPRRPRVSKPLWRARQRFLRGPRLTVRRIGRRRRDPRIYVPIFVDGKLLTIPESRIYRALEDLKIPFVAQLIIGEGRQLGGGIADFWLPAHGVILEYQGPFHQTDEGASRDFFRKATRMEFGAIVTIPLYEADLDRLHDRILELLGMPMVNSLRGRR